MRVLVADDEPGARLVAQGVVEGLGHQCVVAEDGDAAWRLFQQHQPEVLVTDWRMPGLDGLQLCRAVRNAERDSYTYIVLLTSMDRHDDVLSGVEAGADDYVVKPLDPFALHARLLVARRVTSLHAELGRYRAELANQARTDPLTGVRNRLKLTADLGLLHSRSERYARTYSLALCDVDSFKHFNDTYGHQAGDDALRAVAATLVAQLREGEGVYRYGGEEFLVALPEQRATGAAAALERCRKAVERLAIEHSGGPAPVLTISTGVSAFVPATPISSEDVLRQADIALYRAKSSGRNTVAIG